MQCIYSPVTLHTLLLYGYYNTVYNNINVYDSLLPVAVLCMSEMFTDKTLCFSVGN